MTNRRNVKSNDNEATDSHESSKNFLNEQEISLLLTTTKKGRHNIRDHLLLLMIYWHGLRVSEAISLRKSDLNLVQSRVWVSV